jgi:threonyl-tRNA synthetase
MPPDQIHEEILGVLNLDARVYSTFGLDFHLELSTRPEKSIGSDEQWEKATEGLRSALDAYGKGYVINEGDGAFYGPKIDIHIKDAIGRTWQCGTIQLDMSLPERFDLSYIGPDNEKHRPVMIHRVAFGSIERFFGILVEHYAGRFPLWLAPVQAVLLPMNDDLMDYTRQVKKELEAEGLRVEVAGRGESLKRKVRDAQIQQVPVIITLGEKEREAGVFSVRTLDGKVTYGVSRENFLSVVKESIRSRRNENVPTFG